MHASPRQKSMYCYHSGQRLVPQDMFAFHLASCNGTLEFFAFSAFCKTDSRQVSSYLSEVFDSGVVGGDWCTSFVLER